MSHEQQFVEGYDLANWLVGPYDIGTASQETAGQSLEAWQVPFHNVALGALRSLSGRESLPESWQPDPAQGAELYRQLAYERKLHRMIGGLKNYVAERPAGSAIAMFRENQHEMANTLAEIFDGVSLGEPKKLKSPTASGKTAVIVGLVEGLKSQEEAHDEVGILVLVPRKEILLQTIVAFKKFGDNVKPAAYFGDRKELAKVTVMTYQSFLRAYQAGVITREMFQAVVKDESHSAQGKRTAAELHDFCYGSDDAQHMAVFDMSATPRVATKELDYDKSMVEGLRQGVLSPLAARTVTTNSHIIDGENLTLKARDKDFSFNELQGLIDDEERNNAIIDEAIKGLEEGKRTLVRCIPGGNLRHTKILIDMLRGRGRINIMNPYMGDREFRRAHAFAVKGDMPMRTRRLISEVFTDNHNYDLDVLFFVDTLTQGWDSPVAKKIINAAPTRSEWIIEQVFGRVARHYQRRNGEVVTGEAVDFLDHSTNGVMTFAEILNRDAPPGMRYREGVVIGKDLADFYNSPDRPFSAFEPIRPGEH